MLLLGLTGDLAPLCGLKKLDVLNVCDTNLEGATTVAAFQAAKEGVACAVGRYGNEQTPLWRAADCGHVRTTQMLLAGVRRGRRRGRWRGGEEGGVGVVGVRGGGKGRGGWWMWIVRRWRMVLTTALVQAATKGFVEVVRFLVEEGKADVDKAKTDDGSTPSSWRRRRGTRRSCASWWRRARRTWTRRTG